MNVDLRTPGAAGLAAVVDALRAWQYEGGPVQLHPGDLGWLWRAGPAATAAAVRTWHDGDELVAIGMLDSPDLIRLAVAPNRADDPDLAYVVAADLMDASHGILRNGAAAVEARGFPALDEHLGRSGWGSGEPWTPLHRDLRAEVDDPGIRVEVVGAELAAERTAVHRAAFGVPLFTPARWRDMSAGLPYADACCLLAYDDTDLPVAAVTVWSAGPARPGLLEPMGVHPEHRRRGYGRAVTLAAAATLRGLGSSSAAVCTPSADEAAVGTYEAAGFIAGPVSHDRIRR